MPTTDTVSASERLIFTDLQENNNKYWHAEVTGTTLYCEWGRIGNGKQSKSFNFASEAAAQAALVSKTNAKLKKGYTRQQTLGSHRPVAMVAKVEIEHSKDKETTALIDFLVKRNIHKIESTTSIRLESGHLTTPLGPVTEEGLDEAQKLLVAMSKTRSKSFADNVNQYMRIVPRDIGRNRIDPKSLFGSAQQLEAEQAMLDSLRAVVKDIEQKVTTSGPPVFQTKLSIINADAKEFNFINKMFKASLNKNHTSSKFTLYRVWEMRIESCEKRFEEKLGNVRQLWHGTKDANLLSILKQGFIIPKRGSSIAVTGRMFGDGIYFSDQSTKSLNYASGYWGGGASQRCFMLFNDVAMGKEYKPTRSFSGVPPTGFDSTFAEAGKSGVMNNEMIVYRESQVRPQYLCEFR